MNDRPSAEPSSWRRSRSGHKVNLLSCRLAAHVRQCHWGGVHIIMLEVMF